MTSCILGTLGDACTSRHQRELCPSRRLLLAVAVAAHELVHTTSRVDELSLTSKEGVRRAGDFHLDQRVLYSVYDDRFP